MDIKQAMDYLAGNCPTVFEPICNEITGLRKENDTAKKDLTNLRKENDATKKDLKETQNALNELIFSTLKGDM